MVTRPTSSTVSSFSETEYFAILSIMPLEVVIMVVLVVVVMMMVVVMMVMMTVMMVMMMGITRRWLTWWSNCWTRVCLTGRRTLIGKLSHQVQMMI